MAKLLNPAILGLLYVIQSGFGLDYTDDLGRKVFYPLAASAYTNPQACVTKWLGGQVIRQLTILCDKTKNDTCSGYTAIIPDKQAIALVYRGTTTDEQLVVEIAETAEKKVQFGNGLVHLYFYDGFLKLWNAGMKDDFLSLRSRYPAYTIYVTGHSLGGSMATVAANYLAMTLGLSGSQIQLMTFGEPRTGDQAFADEHDSRKFALSSRVVHHNDAAPHIPPLNLNFEHHQTEIWYNNDMTTTDFTVCSGQEDPSCSKSVPLASYNITEHSLYYGVQLDDWIAKGC